MSTRRAFLTAGGVGAAALMLPRASQARDWDDAEKANVKLVNEFCAAWASRDADKLASFMSDDCAVRLSETQPPSKGRAAFVEAVKALFQRVDKVEIEVRETFAVGPLVMN